MTVVVAFHCSDGVVVAVDSMLTPSIGNIQVGHHHGRKVDVIHGPQLFAFAGDQGQGARFRIMADGSHGLTAQVAHPIDYPIALTSSLVQQFTNTGINNSIGVNTVLAYLHGGAHHCCVFEGALQPRLLDADHFYVALGSGKLSADPFLRFLVDIFCKGGQPKVREAIFLAIWTIQHTIDTNSGGVAGPIRVATFERNEAGAIMAHELSDNEKAEHQQAIESATDSLRNWRSQMQGPDPEVPAVPEAPPAV